MGQRKQSRNLFWQSRDKGTVLLSPFSNTLETRGWFEVTEKVELKKEEVDYYKGHGDRSVDPPIGFKVKFSLAALDNTNIVLGVCAFRSKS